MSGDWRVRAGITFGGLSTAAVIAALVSGSGTQRAQSLGLTRHGELVVAQDAGAADVVGLVGITPGTTGQVLTVGDAGIPVWRTPASGGVTASQITDSTTTGRAVLTAASPAEARAALLTTLYASDCTAEAGSESASITGSGSGSTFTLTQTASARLYGTGGATAARIVCPIPAGAREIDVELGPITTASGLATGGWRYTTIAHRNAANGGAPTSLFGAGFNDANSATEVYYGGLMGGSNAGERAAAVQNPPTATNVWVRLVIRPLEPSLTIATGLGVAGARPTAWYPTATSTGIAPPFATAGAYTVADTSVATAIAVFAQSFGGGGTSTLTSGLTIRVTR